MVKHIVLFKLKENLPEEEKKCIMNRFKACPDILYPPHLCGPQPQPR